MVCEQRFIHHHPQRKLVILITRGNPLVVVSKNHPSSTKEGSSSYNHNKSPGEWIPLWSWARIIHHPQRKETRHIIIRSRGMNPVVIVNRNHPSSTKEGSSPYNHKVQGNESCCDRERNYPSSTKEGSSSYNHNVQGNESCCDREQESSIVPKGSSVIIRRRGRRRRRPKFAGSQVPRRRRFAWSWNFATSRSPVADRRRWFEQRQGINCYFTRWRAEPAVNATVSLIIQIAPGSFLSSRASFEFFVFWENKGNLLQQWCCLASILIFCSPLNCLW